LGKEDGNDNSYDLGLKNLRGYGYLLYLWKQIKSGACFPS
jgi:hypothetical protein